MNVAIRRYPAVLSFALAITLGGCHASTGPAPFGGVMPAGTVPRAASAPQGRLGNVLMTKDGGEIFGFDINQNGADGALASSRDTNKPGVYRVSVETFDQDTGAITSSFAEQTSSTSSFGFDGIFMGDAGLVTHYVTPKGGIYATRYYELMNPVTAQRFTGKWVSPIPDIDVLQAGVNQSTAKAVLFAIELKNGDRPVLVATDVANAVIDNVIPLDPSLFGGANGPQLGQYIAGDSAVIALSPDAGTVGGQAPLNVVVNLTTGKQIRFPGYNNGNFHAGSVDGIAVDPNTGVEVTTTALNSQVEFYDVVKRVGITAAQLPCTTSTGQTTSGTGIAADPIHKLFLVTVPTSGCNGGGQIVVYNERGVVVETISGFTFALAEPAPVLNPSKRMGWTFGPKFSQLQQFFY